MKLLGGVLIILALLLVIFWQSSNNDEYRWDLAAGMPVPAVPVNNPMSGAKVQLGRLLFYDQRLSVNTTTSCASCHLQSLAFTDGLPKSVGATGAVHPRSSMSLVNVAYNSRLTWANHLLAQIEDQMLTPMFGENPIEMGMGGLEDAMVALLHSDPEYAELAPKAFPEETDPYSVIAIIRSISAFVRTIVSDDAPYDRYIRGDEKALDEAAERGMELFFSERLECFHCHGGFNFTDSTTHADALVESIGYHNTGLYNTDGNGAYPVDNTGLLDMTGVRRDMGRFKAPTLRNIALTAPYMHDGSIATLDDVIDHYERGGRQITNDQYAGDGRLSPYKSEFVRGFELSVAERADLISFLQALTDRDLIERESLSDPRPGSLD
jgi:cytochrome c peroxidase